MHLPRIMLNLCGLYNLLLFFHKRYNKMRFDVLHQKKNAFQCVFRTGSTLMFFFAALAFGATEIVPADL